MRAGIIRCSYGGVQATLAASANGGDGGAPGESGAPGSPSLAEKKLVSQAQRLERVILAGCLTLLA